LTSTIEMLARRTTCASRLSRVQFDTTDNSNEETLVHSQDEADSTDEVGYGQANATYQDAIWSNYATSVGNALSGVPSGTPESALLQYYASIALDESNQVSTDGSDLVNEETQISGQEVTLGDETEAALVGQTNADDAAQQTEMGTLLSEEVQAVKNADADLTQAVGSDADAQAAYQTSVADAVAQFYQDKAAASQTHDNAVAAAMAAQVKGDASNWVAYLENNITLDQLNAENAADSDTMNAAVQAARVAELGGYGDAEITEATTIGTAEVTLATAQGADEVGLAGDEAQVADTLTGETVSAQETLGGAIADENTTDAETVAGDESDTTTNEGTEENSTEQGLAGEEVTTAGNLAGAQADYAIAVAQILAAAATGLSQADPSDGQAAFDALYADGYVTWLTDLKASFVADASGVAQAAATDEENLLAADVNLADQEAAANVNYVDGESPQAAQESDTLAQEGDGYTTATIGEKPNAGQSQN